MKALFLSHNHPSLHPGGTEIFARDLFRQLRSDGMEGLFIGCTDRAHREARPGTVFQGAPLPAGQTASDEMLLWTGHFERFYLSQVDLHSVVPELRTLLQQEQFDVVHLHHVLLLGLEVLPLLRFSLPDTRIILTLHDFFSLCANDGLLLTSKTHQPCFGPSPDACHRCFPATSQEKFVLRDLQVRNHLAYVDAFIAPSQFLKDRYVAWGLPAEKIHVVRNARPAVTALLPRPLPVKTGKRDRFGYIGNISPHKGLPVLLDAMAHLQQGKSSAFLSVHGDMPFQSEAFRSRIEERLKELNSCVHHAGAYTPGQLGGFLQECDWVVVPSIWWENAPLVIAEAQAHGRPVLVSDIGGMAEAVARGGGLTFPVGNSAGLTQVMQQAMQPAVWQKAVDSIPVPRTLAECAAEHRRLYQQNSSAYRVAV